MKQPLIISHANCPDGLVAAWCLHQVFGDAAEYVFCHYNTDEHLKPDVTGRDVYFVDFSAPRADLLAMAAKATSVTVADHHATARDALSNESQWAPDNLRLIFDMKKAGCRLAWDLATELRGNTPVDPSELVAYTEDRDLWNWALPHSHAINAWIGTFPRTFAGMYTANGLLRQDPQTAIASGQAILAYRDIRVAAAGKGLIRITDADGRIVLFGNVTEFGSEVGNDALIAHPDVDYVVMYRDVGKTGTECTQVFSLRARKGGVDVSAIAKANGGGGHPAAAGFSRTIIGETSWLTNQS